MTDTTTTTTERVLLDWELREHEQNIARLEANLEFLRNHPLICAHTYISQVHTYASNKEDFQAMLEELGSFEKSENGYSVVAKRKLDGSQVNVSLDHSQFCEKVEDGVELVEEEVYPEDVKPTVVTKEVPKYKWVCPDSWKNA